MNPWQTVWAPHLNLPWSGSVAQKIEPNSNWFLNYIDSDAGDARIERKAFEKASYGRQIGWLTEIVIALSEESEKIDKGEKSTLTRLRKINFEIEEIKKQQASFTANEIEEKLQWLKKNNNPEYEALSRRIISIISEKNERSK